MFVNTNTSSRMERHISGKRQNRHASTENAHGKQTYATWTNDMRVLVDEYKDNTYDFRCVCRILFCCVLSLYLYGCTALWGIPGGSMRCNNGAGYVYREILSTMLWNAVGRCFCIVPWPMCATAYYRPVYILYVHEHRLAVGYPTPNHNKQFAFAIVQSGDWQLKDWTGTKATGGNVGG